MNTTPETIYRSLIGSDTEIEASRDIVSCEDIKADVYQCLTWAFQVEGDEDEANQIAAILGDDEALDAFTSDVKALAQAYIDEYHTR